MFEVLKELEARGFIVVDRAQANSKIPNQYTLVSGLSLKRAEEASKTSTD